jgi:poly(ADP-ribose) glycohydrolase ARH3
MNQRRAVNRPLVLEGARFRGALLGALVGDALGAPFEGHPGLVAEAEFDAVLHASSSLRYTDDTAMMIALAESLIRTGRLDQADLARSFADAWAAAPGLGYSRRTAGLLRRLLAGEQWSAARDEPGRASNGAAMRVAPAALLTAARGGEVAGVARLSAQVTHRHPRAGAGAAVQAVAIAAAARHPSGAPLDAARVLEAVCVAASDPVLEDALHHAVALSARGDAAEIAARVGTGITVTESVPAAVCAALSHPDSFPAALTLAISLGGDADTIAAMTGAISGALLGEEAIPVAWLARTRGAGRVRRLADALYRTAHQLTIPVSPG